MRRQVSQPCDLRRGTMHSKSWPSFPLHSDSRSVGILVRKAREKLTSTSWFIHRAPRSNEGKTWCLNFRDLSRQKSFGPNTLALEKLESRNKYVASKEEGKLPSKYISISFYSAIIMKARSSAGRSGMKPAEYEPRI